MIPRRIKLSGFLSYKIEQEITFDSASLWMLTGPNGSGKSTVFDAITYSLFGHHRGGSLMVQELINKDSSGLSVEFEFWLDGKLFQIRRTAKRSARGGTQATQQIYQSHSGLQNPTWLAVPDTGKKTGFDQWIRDRIGLQYETFTSSVLLLQGKAEKLLDASPKGRAELLACIVDLERYQRLHAKADEKRKVFKDEVDLLEAQLEKLPETTDEQWQAAAERLELAEKEYAQANAEVEQAVRRESEAMRWEELQGRLTRLREQCRQAGELLGDAATIDAEHERFKELREVLPQVTAIQQLSSDIAKSLDESRQLTAEAQKVAARRDERNHALDLARQNRAKLQERQACDDKRRQDVEVKLRDLAGVLERLRLFEDEQTRLIDAENKLKKLPSDPQRSAREAQERVDHCVASAGVLPTLERFTENRQALADWRGKLAAAAAAETTIRQQGEAEKQKSQKAKEEHDGAVVLREAADAQATASETLLAQSREALDECDQLQGKTTCRLCGQRLTAAHLKSEKSRRRFDFEAAETKFNDAQDVQKQARAEVARLHAEIQSHETALVKLRDSYSSATAEKTRVEHEIERSTQECRKAYEGLVNGQREKIAAQLPEDPTVTTFPTVADLAAIRREVERLDELRQAQREAEDAARNWERLRTLADNSRQALERLRKALPAGEPSVIRADHQKLQAEEATLKNSLAGATKALGDNQIEIDRIQDNLAEIEKSAAEYAGKVAAGEAYRKNNEEAIERAVRALPEIWRSPARAAGLAELHGWTVEYSDLEAKGAVKRFEQLAQARLGLEGLRQELTGAEELAAKFPEESRVSGSEAARLLDEARQAAAAKDEQFRTMQRENDDLLRNREQRAQWRTQLFEKSRELQLFETLAKLLGRDRLQRQLVRQAEKQIVDLANGVLDRLSGGQLYLRLCGSEENASSDRALELEAYNRITGEQPINVAFLSGSQRFRVAVSLALGIGHFAGKLHRPIESVIIDEGFGSLDREGRQVMIQELQNLRGQLRCILLVSHQEEFADAFPDRYRFELQGGTTHVTRIQR
jgi:DNA repair exonuclease SbcCD ATPase subunit